MTRLSTLVNSTYHLILSEASTYYCFSYNKNNIRVQQCITSVIVSFCIVKLSIVTLNWVRPRIPSRPSSSVLVLSYLLVCSMRI